MVDKLAGYGEVKMLVVAGRTYVLELWVDPRDLSWTIVRSTPDGFACMLDAGVGVFFTTPDPVGDPS